MMTAGAASPPSCGPASVRSAGRAKIRASNSDEQGAQDEQKDVFHLHAPAVFLHAAEKKSRGGPFDAAQAGLAQKCESRTGRLTASSPNNIAGLRKVIAR